MKLQSSIYIYTKVFIQITISTIISAIAESWTWNNIYIKGSVCSEYFIGSLLWLLNIFYKNTKTSAH